MNSQRKTFIQREDLAKDIFDDLASLTQLKGNYESLYDRLTNLSEMDMNNETYQVIKDLLIGFQKTGKSAIKRLEELEMGSAEGFIKSNKLRGLANQYFEYVDGDISKQTIKDIKTGDTIMVTDFTYGDLSLTLEQIDQGMSPPSSVQNPENIMRRAVTKFQLSNQTTAEIEEIFNYDTNKNLISVIVKEKHHTDKAKLTLLNNIAYQRLDGEFKVTWALPTQTIDPKDLTMVGVNVYQSGYLIHTKEVSINTLSITMSNLEKDTLYDIEVYGLNASKRRSDEVRLTYHSDMITIPGQIPGQVQEMPQPPISASISKVTQAGETYHKLFTAIDTTDVNFTKIVVNLYEAPIESKRVYITSVESATNTPSVLLGKLYKGLRYEVEIYTMNQAEEKTSSPLTVLFIAE